MASDAEIKRLSRRVDELEQRIERLLGVGEGLSVANQAAMIRAQGGSISDHLREKSRLDTARRRRAGKRGAHKTGSAVFK
ncbi:MAG: hypothetical protein P1P81_08175 [Desulfobulbales bacterium]|nr:hypothetical protein [Desulfobulbales bacterium]